MDAKDAPAHGGYPNTVKKTEVEHEAIHGFFGLTYANYLVLNRSLLQSMPDDWQEKFVKLLEEFGEEFGWAMQLQPSINVQILASEPQLVEEEEECEYCKGTGKDPDDPEEECADCIDGVVSVEGDRYQEPEEVGIITDPVAHYERGRAVVPLASMSVEEVLEHPHWRMIGEWMRALHREEWRKLYGPEFDVGQEVQVHRHRDHALPPVLDEQKGMKFGFWDGKIVEAIDHCLYKVEVILSYGTGEKTAPVVVQLHADQIEA